MSFYCYTYKLRQADRQKYRETQRAIQTERERDLMFQGVEDKPSSFPRLQQCSSLVQISLTQCRCCGGGRLNTGSITASHVPSWHWWIYDIQWDHMASITMLQVTSHVYIHMHTASHLDSHFNGNFQTKHRLDVQHHYYYRANLHSSQICCYMAASDRNFWVYFWR